MHSKINRVHIAAFLVLLAVVGLTGTAQAGGIPWQVGDVVICYGGGQCNVVRIHGSTVQLLDSLSDTSPVGSGGNTFGAALNNTLHLLATDDGGSGSSKVVVYSIASVNPFSGAVLSHSVINTPYNASATTGDSAAAIAVNSAGHLFVGNSNTGGASIVELNADGSRTGITAHVFTFPTTGSCATTTLNSLDIGATADAVYVTAKDGIIRKVALPLSASSACSQFANFGSEVFLYGIKDIPAGALSVTCGSNPPNPVNNPCPSGESVLVVATGFTDPDDATTNETGETGPDTDAVNICTNAADQTPVSCALLLDTAGAGLTAQPWVAKNLYGTAGVPILDPHSHVQQVLNPGTSGADEPIFDQSGGITDDNLVIWTNEGQKLWIATHGYISGDKVVDPAGHVQEVTTGGTSAAAEPSPWTDSSAPTFGDTTTDGLKWADQGQKLWANDHPFNSGNIIVDSAGHVQKVTTAGTSGPNTPSFADTPASGGATITDGLQWVLTTCDGCTIASWVQQHPYSIGDNIQDANTGTNVWTVSTPGRSGLTEPTFSGSGPVPDNAVIWTDQGTWVPTTQYNVGAQVGDTNSHLFQATIGGKSGSGSPNFIAAEGGSVYDNAVTWTDRGAWQQNHAYTSGAQVGDTGHYLWQETNTNGTSAPNPPAFTSHDVPSVTVKDGLQWTDQPNPSVLARYPVTGVNTLQSLALDPLVAKCTGNSGTACATTAPPARQVTNSNPPTAPSFWMAGSAGGTIYRQNFGGGTPASFNAPTGNNPVQSLVVYGGEGANQPGLASLVLAGSLSSSSLPAPFTATATILGNTITSTLSNNTGVSGPPPATPISLYASVVDKNSCFNDPSAGSLPCRPTGQAIPSNALVWKIDTPLNGTAALPTTETLNTSFGPVGLAGVDNGTDVFVDEQFDDTTFAGTDPGTRTISVHSLHELTPTFPLNTAQCKYSSPIQNGCYKLNRNTLNFTFSCSGIPPSQFGSLTPAPMLALVKKNTNQSPQFINLTNSSGTNGKGPFRYDASSNSWTFQLNLNGFTKGQYIGTAQDPNKIANLPVTFFLQTSCP